jgi:hypothetical protein
MTDVAITETDTDSVARRKPAQPDLRPCLLVGVTAGPARRC